MLPLEANLVCGDAIGEVTEFPFYFEVVDDRRIRQPHRVLNAEEREWVKGYIDNQVEMGVLERVTIADPMPTFISNVVLVREGQSSAKGKTYRLAPNLAEANSRIILPALPMDDC